MSTDLRTALREAVTDEPTFDLDPATLAMTGGRRARRRTRLAVGATALATGAVLAAVAVLADRPAVDHDPDPARTELRRLDLDDSAPARPDVLVSTRTAWDKNRDSLEYDELVGITADGLIVRGRHTREHGAVELGLLDPSSGTTQWLPTPRGRLIDAVPVDLTAERLVLALAAGTRHSMLVFDRATAQWQREVIEVPPGIEVHVPPLLELGADGRLYIGTALEGDAGPLHWWSAAVPDGGAARPEPDLQGAAVTWGDGARLTADNDGRVVLTSSAGATTVVADRRPPGCEQPTDFPDTPVRVVLAGDVPVVTFPCEGDQLTLVYRDGEDPVAIRGVTALAGDAGHVVLATVHAYQGALMADPGHPSHTFLLDLADLSLDRVGEGPHEEEVALAAGLMLWNEPGPGDTSDGYDVVWNVARLR